MVDNCPRHSFFSHHLPKFKSFLFTRGTGRVRQSWRLMLLDSLHPPVSVISVGTGWWGLSYGISTALLLQESKVGIRRPTRVPTGETFPVPLLKNSSRKRYKCYPRPLGQAVPPVRVTEHGNAQHRALHAVGFQYAGSAQDLASSKIINHAFLPASGICYFVSPLFF